MDTAKALGIIIANPEFEDVRSLEGVAPTKNPSVPIIAVPTTAGTAAEVTINYVITDVEKKRKFVCVDTHDIPVVACLLYTSKQYKDQIEAVDGVDQVLWCDAAVNIYAGEDFISMDDVEDCLLYPSEPAGGRTAGRYGLKNTGK